MPTTGLMTCALKPGSAIDDASKPEAQVAKDSLQTISQADGVGQIQFGMQVESPNVLQILIDWNKIEDQNENFEAQAHYPAFVERFVSVADGRPSFTHIDFVPEGGLSKATSAPVTEVATFYFDGAPPADYIDGVLKFVALTDSAKTEGFLGAATGLTYEELEREGVTGKAAVLFVGWASVDAHMKFRETSTLKDNIHLLLNGAPKIEMHHTQFMNYVPE